MRRFPLAAAVIVVVIGAAMSGGRTAAMPFAAPPASAGARGAAVQLVRSICGINGCAPVLTKRIVKPPRSFTTRAAPLVVPGAPAPPPAPAAASTAPWPLSLLQGKL
jgi:hypothetical protein